MYLKLRRARNERGSIIFVGVGFLIVVLALGALAYDITLVRQQYNQLKAATDAAALATASWLTNSDNTDTGTDVQISADAIQIALPYFTSNGLAAGPKYKGDLHNTTVSTTDITNDKLTKLGQSKIYLKVDTVNRTATVESEFCVQPSILSALGLYTLHARSVGGPGTGPIGDVCFVVDLSATMTLATPATNVVEYVFPPGSPGFPPGVFREIGELTLKGDPNVLQRLKVPGHLVLNTAPLTKNGYDVSPFRANGLPPGGPSTTKLFGTPTTAAIWFGGRSSNHIVNANNIAFTPSDPTYYNKPTPATLPPIPNTNAPLLAITKESTPFLFETLDDFASKNPNTPVPNDIEYPKWPTFPAINPHRDIFYKDATGRVVKAGDLDLDTTSNPVTFTTTSATPGTAGTTTTKTPTATGFVTTTTTIANVGTGSTITTTSTTTTFAVGYKKPLKFFQYTTFTVPEMMTYVLAAAKIGLLEDKKIFDLFIDEIRTKDPATAIALKDYLPNLKFHPGYRREYQKLAMTQCQAIETQVAVMHDVIENVGASNARWSLVGFGSFAPETGASPAHVPSNSSDFPYDWKPLNKKGQTREPDQFQFPLVPLKKDSSNAAQVLALIDQATASYGTATASALREGIQQLNGPEHRPGESRTLILMTDGIPTQGGSFAQIKKLKGIKLVGVGLFEGNYACPAGPRFLKKLGDQAGSTARIYNFIKTTRRCGTKAENLTSTDLATDALEISEFIKKNMGGNGNISLLE